MTETAAIASVAGGVALASSVCYWKLFRPAEKFRNLASRVKKYPAEVMRHPHPTVSLLATDPEKEFGQLFEDGGEEWTISSGYYAVRSRRFKTPKPNPGYDPELVSEGSTIDIWYQTVLPRDISRLRCLLVMSHGYGDHCDYLVWHDAMCFHQLSKGQIGIVMFDQPGHGRTKGVHTMIPDWFSYVDSCQHFIEEFVSQKLKVDLEAASGRALPLFGCGASMGGAVNISMALICPQLFDGLILLCPMVKISEAVKPPEIVTKLFVAFGKAAPTWPVAPAKDFNNKLFVYKDKTELFVKQNRLFYSAKPRLGTAISVLAAQDWICVNMERFSQKVFLLHGASDEITDPHSTQEFFERCSSDDKKLKIYPHMTHVMTWGQPVADSYRVFTDAIDWLGARSPDFEVPVSAHQIGVGAV